MQQYPALRRLVAVLTALSVMGTVVVIAATWKRPSAEPAPNDQGPKVAAWPMWGGSQSRNMVNLVDTNLPLKWEIKGGVKGGVLWSQDLGSKAYGGPVIADGKVFVGTNNEKPRDPKVMGDKGVIMCFEEKTGKFLWQRVHDKLPAGMVQDWPLEGICSSCAVEADKIYYVSNRCELVCATTEGKDVWTLDMIKTLGVFPHNLSTSSPVIAGDYIFVVTSNGVNEDHITVPAPAAPSFICVDKRNAKVIWSNNDPSERLVAVQKQKANQTPKQLFKTLVNDGGVIIHGQWSSPAYAEVNGEGQIIFPGGDGWLRSYEAKTGKLLWKFDCNPKSAKYRLGHDGTRNDFISTPVVHNNRVYIGVGQDPEHDEGVGHFWCIDITKKGDVSPKEDNFDPKAPVNKDSALVWHYGEPSPKAWKVGRNYVFGRTLSTAAVHDGLVYIAELAGRIHCLDADNGQQYWTHYVSAPIWSSPYWVDGKVYLGTDGKEVFIFGHGKQKNLLAQVPMDNAVRATPVVVSGVMYIMVENKLHAIKK
jgi:outer membrane protein assembly factor BamB